MKNKNLIIGVCFAVALVLLMFITPIFWKWYRVTFEIAVESMITVVFGIMVFSFGFITGAIIHFDKVTNK